jgi:aryl-alcohol dehydrogenase (NADP+)
MSWVPNSSFVSAVIAGPRGTMYDYLKALDYRFTAEDEALIEACGDGHPRRRVQ